MPRYRANKRPRFSNDMSSRCIRQVLPNLPQVRSLIKLLFKAACTGLLSKNAPTYMCKEGLVCLQACICFLTVH